MNIQNQRIEFAHALRGIAVISVLMSLFLGEFWLNPATVGNLLNADSLTIIPPIYISALHFSLHFNYGSFGVALIIFSLFYLTRSGFKTNRMLDWLADISYPVYAVHPILGYTLMYLLVNMNVPVPAIIVIVLGVVIFTSWTIHILIESPMLKIGKNLANSVFPKDFI